MNDSHYALRISANAFADANQIASWYETKVNELGDQFLDDLEEAYKSVLSHPASFSRYKKGSKIRKKLLKVFPYIIYYLIEDMEVKVFAIIHTSRSQKFITRKLR